MVRSRSFWSSQLWRCQVFQVFPTLTAPKASMDCCIQSGTVLSLLLNRTRTGKAQRQACKQISSAKISSMRSWCWFPAASTRQILRSVVFIKKHNFLHLIQISALSFSWWTFSFFLQKFFPFCVRPQRVGRCEEGLARCLRSVAQPRAPWPKCRPSERHCHSSPPNEETKWHAHETHDAPWHAHDAS